MEAQNLTIAGLLRWIGKEAERVPQALEISGGRQYFRLLMFNRMVNGDESFVEPALTDLYWRLVHDKIGSEDRAVLACLLLRFSGSDAGRKIASGAEKRGGQPRKGWVGLSIAGEVSDLLVKEGITAESAWEKVGEKRHLTASAVKGHWMKWKPRLLDGARDFVREKFPSAAEDELAVLAKVAVLGTKSMTPADAQVWVRVTVNHQERMIDGQSLGAKPRRD